MHRLGALRGRHLVRLPPQGEREILLGPAPQGHDRATPTKFLDGTFTLSSFHILKNLRRIAAEFQQTSLDSWEYCYLGIFIIVILDPVARC